MIVLAVVIVVYVVVVVVVVVVAAAAAAVVVAACGFVGNLGAQTYLRCLERHLGHSGSKSLRESLFNPND